MRHSSLGGTRLRLARLMTRGRAQAPDAFSKLSFVTASQAQPAAALWLGNCLDGLAGHPIKVDCAFNYRLGVMECLDRSCGTVT